jgi:alpha-methylacyl-CoA racemase
LTACRSQKIECIVNRLNNFLAGVRVLDLSMSLPGPFVAQMLSDMGADVLKVEPLGGDPLFALPGGRGTLYYDALNAGKTVMRVDLKTTAGHAAIRRAIREADVLIEGFRPGVMLRLGIDYAQVRDVNPRIVYCSLSGYGQDGSQRAGHDGNFMAEAGILGRNGLDGPAMFDPPIADHAAGLFAASAILGALYAVMRGEAGCHIDVALADAVMPLQTREIVDSLSRGHAPLRNRTLVDGGAAFYRIYALNDGGHVALCAVEQAFWSEFCSGAERPEWVVRHNDPFPQSQLIAEVADFFSTLSRPECAARFAGRDACISLLCSPVESLESDHVRKRGLIASTASDGVQMLYPCKVDGRAPGQRRPLRLVDPVQIDDWLSAASTQQTSEAINPEQHRPAS